MHQRKRPFLPLQLFLLAVAAFLSLSIVILLRNQGIPHTTICTIVFLCIVFFVFAGSVISLFLRKQLLDPLEQIQGILSGLPPHQGDTLFSNPVTASLARSVQLLQEQNSALIQAQYTSSIDLLFVRMRSLESQVNAHFLNNTLEAINSIAALNELDDISTMSLSLANMFRYSIRTAGSLVTLRDELSHLQDYVAISEIRFRDKFKVYYDIDPDVLDCRILKIILQPIVENAVYHGLNPCRNHNGRIDIAAHRTERGLSIEVSDNGIGISPETLKRIREDIATPICFNDRNIVESRPIGLKNVNSRIQLYYGTNYGIQISSEQDKGTKVTIVLPVYGEASNV